jgi:hypothetical protein
LLHTNGNRDKVGVESCLLFLVSISAAATDGTLKDVLQTLRNADAAGDEAAATRLAQIARELIVQEQGDSVQFLSNLASAALTQTQANFLIFILLVQG